MFLTNAWRRWAQVIGDPAGSGVNRAGSPAVMPTTDRQATGATSPIRTRRAPVRRQARAHQPEQLGSAEPPGVRSIGHRSGARQKEVAWEPQTSDRGRGCRFDAMLSARGAMRQSPTVEVGRSTRAALPDSATYTDPIRCRNMQLAMRTWILPLSGGSTGNAAITLSCPPRPAGLNEPPLSITGCRDKPHERIDDRTRRRALRR